MAEHTPGRLTIDQWGGVITEDGDRLLLAGVAIPAGGYDPRQLVEANTARMVRAWNAHDELYAACEDVLTWIEDETFNDLEELSDDVKELRATLKAALAKARGEVTS